MKNMKRTMVLLVAFALLMGCAIGGTLAWLTVTTGDVVNTFTVGDINIDINEHDYNPSTGVLNTDDVVKKNDDYKFVPGAELPKDPYVTVRENSEACWLFVEITETNNTRDDLTGKIIGYTVDENVWTKLEGENNVWYKDLGATAEDTDYYILTDNKVSVNDDVTKEMVTDINEAKPKLNFKAYAIQSVSLKDDSGNTIDTAVKAWELLKPTIGE